MRAFLKNLGKFVYMQQLNKALSTLIVLFLAITMVFGEGAPFIVNATGAVMTSAMVGTMSAGGAVYGASMGAKIIAQGGAQALASRTGLTSTVAALHIMGQNITAHGLRGAGLGLQNAARMPMGAHVPLRGIGSALTAFGSKMVINPEEMRHYARGREAEVVLTDHAVNNFEPMQTGINYHEALEKCLTKRLLKA